MKSAKKWREKSMAAKILTVIGLMVLAVILWIGFDVVKGLLSKDAPRKPKNAGDTADYGYSGIQMAVWLIEHPDRENGSIYYAQTEEESDSLFAWRSIPNSITHADLTEEKLLKYIKPAADFMAKRYDCSDFRAIWLCKLRYALADSKKYGQLLTDKVDSAIRDALTGFKYFITSSGEDSMCYYSENHQMVFAVSEYYAGLAYPDTVFTIDGKNGSEHAAAAKSRMDNWFDQRGRYGFSEFLSSNYLAVDIGALGMLKTYCVDEVLAQKAELALNMIFLDCSLQMYDFAMTAPTGRNYARNNTSFNASYALHTIVDKVWNTGETDIDNVYSGFPYLFISLVDSGKYTVPKAIVNLGRINAKGVVKTTSGLTLKEMEEKDLIGLSDYQLQFQLGMGALSNKEVISNTLNALNRYDLVHNNFVSGFKFFNIKLFQLLGLTETLAQAVNPFSNGMAIERNEVYTYSTDDYKLSTNQLYRPGSFGAQQLTGIACLPNRINVFTANPMKGKQFQGYGVAPCAAQDRSCMLSIYDIPKKTPLLATGDILYYTATYFPREKFEEVIPQGNYIFGRIRDTFIAVIGASELKFEEYKSEEEFEKKIFDFYELYEGSVGPDIDLFRLSNSRMGFELRQQGRNQFTIYELGSAGNETFKDFVERIKSNPVSFKNNTLKYTTLQFKNVIGDTSETDTALNPVYAEKVTYVLNYNGSFTVNEAAVSAEHDRYDSEFVHAGRGDSCVTVSCEGEEYTLELEKLFIQQP